MSLRPDGGRNWWVREQTDQHNLGDTVGSYGKTVYGPYGDDQDVVTAAPSIHQWLFPPNVTPPIPPANPLKWGDMDEWKYQEIPPGANVDPTLVRIGNSPFWRTSNEPVDPRDCRRWPNSPYCGTAPNPFSMGSNVLPVVSQTQCEICISFQPNFLGISGPITRFCYRRFSDGACKVPAIKEQLPPSYPEEDRRPRYPMPVAPFGFARALYACNCVTEVWGPDSMADVETPLYSKSWAFAQFLNYVDQQFPGFFRGTDNYSRWRTYSEPGVVRSLTTDTATPRPYQPWESMSGYSILTYRSGRPPFPIVGRFTYSGGTTPIPGLATVHRAKHTTDDTRTVSLTVPGVGTYSVKMRHYFIDETWLHWRDWPVGVGLKRALFYLNSDAWEEHVSDAYLRYSYNFGTAVPWSSSLSSGFHYVLPPQWMKLVAVDLSSDVIPPIDLPVPVKEEPDPMDCCEEVLEKLEKIELRLGCDEFPVDLPATLTNAAAGQAEIENHAQFLAWFVRNLDALFGQFPIKITIADSDPTKEGEQEVDVEIPNLAEGLAEVFGLAYQSEIKADLLSEMLMRLIPEVIAGKNAAIVAQSYSKANASYMGYPGNLRPTEVQSNFNLSEVKSLPEFLKESKGKLLTYHEESKDTLQDKLERLMFAAGIIKSVFMVDGKDADRLIETIEKMFDDEADNIASNKRSWEEWVRDLRKDTAPGNKDQRIVPEVVIQAPPDGPEPV